jgi:hypothetical protein
MIKIRIEKVDQLREEYYLLLKKTVVSRLGYFDIALDHVICEGANIGKSVDATVRAGTKRILSIMQDIKVDKKEFEGKKFAAAVQKYALPAKTLAGVDLELLKDLIKTLCDLRNEKLYLLLTCPPDQLEKHNLDLINDFKLGSVHLKLLSIPFNYELNDEIANLIKIFFRTKNLVRYCPYCNQDPAMYSGLANGRTIRVHQLDHFYDKATRPLLCYSMFNLVPGDWTCNSLDKGTKPFTFDGHLNPYSEGFGADMVFGSDNIGTLRPMSKVKLNIPYSVGSEKRRRMIGDRMDVDETHSIGNINVFGLKAKYNDVQVVSEAEKVQRLVIDNWNNLGSLKDFLAKMPVASAYERYKQWYEFAVRAPFEEADFNDQRYSKLFRDLHDEFFKNDKQEHNDVIREIIGIPTSR